MTDLEAPDPDQIFKFEKFNASGNVWFELRWDGDQIVFNGNANMDDAARVFMELCRDKGNMLFRHPDYLRKAAPQGEE